ncbi:MAG: DNA repair protein RecN [Candidatus Binatia bacterium]
MLRELRIRDVAIIEDLTLAFGPGLNVITGETGAGKSILLHALTLLCGARGHVDLIRAAADEAVVEGLFECSPPAMLRDALGLGEDGEVLVRRHVPRSGKGRIHINGGPATLPLLGQLGEHLVHIYGQHEQALLLRPASHLDLLDRYADLRELRGRMTEAHRALVHARRRAAELADRAAALEERRDLLEFQQRELANAATHSGEEGALRGEREQLRHAGRLQALCREGDSVLYAGPNALLSVLDRLQARVAELTEVAPSLVPIAELIQNGRLQLDEAALQLRAAAARFEHDPQRQEAVEERLALLHRLSRKYGVDAEALPAALAAIERDLGALEGHAGEAAAAARAVAECEAAAVALSALLSEARRAAARRLEQQMVAELAALGMREARFAVVQEFGQDAADLGSDGADHVEFFISSNPSEPNRPLARVASGGELSRIMLALKALTAAVGETPILIFDEVDAGVGGAVADAVARRLKTLGQNRQLLCITHLPQIAAYADHHIAVDKRTLRGRTTTHARAVDGDARVAEMARMLSGGRAPAEAVRYARRLLAEARRG